ncbi:restriction endonuclease subunit S [Staphylococcus chromogenes]|uniref:restriction endonuclease subunit S n=1 Tax=Staphylococcus TaxID=1279 RepID=UPI001405022B|nr:MULTISPECIES: restriction endonuclease subunit S [Staphylococcus]MCE4976000.1 restriction endonuclease subunit S [Staphylococcus hominis]QIN25555.1 restriction endonuclease subunit S [Staphylococcus chromogenes]
MTEIANTPELRFPNYENSWFSYKLNDISERVTRKNKNLESQRPLTISGQLGLIDQIEYFNKSVSSKNLTGYTLIKKGEFAYNKSYSNGYPLGAIKKLERYDLGILSSLYICFSFDENIDKSFMKNYFESTKWYREVANIAVEGARNHGLLNIPVNDFFNININLPIQYEQEKIGEFFSKLDRQIELEEQKLEKLEEQKKGYMQKIFSQELRFKDKNGNEYPEWEVIKLKDILSERKEYASKIGNYPHATLSTSGISLKSDRYNRDFLVKDKNKKYKVTIMNDICYNPANLKFGVITRNHIGSVIFSPIYITFEVNNAHSPLFIELLVTRNDFINRVRKYEEGTVYERMAVKPEDFLNYETKIPCLEEQEKIGNFFSKLDELINKQNQKIDGLKKRKRGFLQKMFV